MKYLLPFCAPLMISCTGILDGTEEPFALGAGVSSAGSSSQQGGAATSSTGGAAAQASDTPFSVRIGEPELLPFDVRVRRIANTLQVTTTNPMFAEMSAKSIQLGDYDHASGALPDNLWLARRLSGWADALTPVCGSTEMKTLFPALPENVAQLIKAAWGRTATDEEVAEIKAAVSEAALPNPALSYEATCMAIFTAAEFVFR